MKKIIISYLFINTFMATYAIASEGASGEFQSVRKCEAYQSFSKGTNPGIIYTTPGKKYEILEVNNQRKEWIRINIEEATAGPRWVSSECGFTRNVAVKIVDNAKEKQKEFCQIPDQYDSFVLASTWQPGFCEHFNYRGEKPECDALKSGDLVISHLTLHGLWPNKASCGTSYGHCNNSELKLSEDTLSYIKPWMPNFYYGSSFGQYEWSKHGVCQTKYTADEYFKIAVDLVKSLNDSPIGNYITSNIGGSISKEKFNETVSNYFQNPKAKNNFLLLCSGKYLQEIRINLPKDIKINTSIKDTLKDYFLDNPSRDNSQCASDNIQIEISGKKN